jgi:two-component system, NarL family, nitrate/nitrite response regulator NarL
MTTVVHTVAHPVPDEPSAHIRVLVVDGYSFSRLGLSSLLRSAALDVVGEAGDAVTAAAIGRRLSPDVALMDLDLLGTSGVEAVRLMSVSSPLSRVVAIIGPEHQDVIATLTMGACGCVLRGGPTHEVVAAIRAAAMGESLVSPPLTSSLVHRLRAQSARAPRRVPALSPRECQVLDLLARGWDNARIAAALYVSLGTVKHHISNILSKLGVENRIQAAVRAVQDGLLDERVEEGRP